MSIILNSNKYSATVEPCISFPGNIIYAECALSPFPRLIMRCAPYKLVKPKSKTKAQRKCKSKQKKRCSISNYKIFLQTPPHTYADMNAWA